MSIDRRNRVHFEETADQYLKLLQTQSIYRSLAEGEKEGLFSAVSLFLNQIGGTISLPTIAVLFHASVQ